MAVAPAITSTIQLLLGNSPKEPQITPPESRVQVGDLIVQLLVPGLATAAAEGALGPDSHLPPGESVTQVPVAAGVVLEAAAEAARPTVPAAAAAGAAEERVVGPEAAAGDRL